MVKIKAKLLLVSAIMLIFLMGIAHAQTQHLKFSDVDVKVGSKTSKNLKNGDRIGEEAEPGDTVEFRVEVLNNYTSSEDIEIKDVSVEVTIEDIDDGEELDDESNDFDLDAGDDKKVTLKFQVPLEVEEDDFDVLIEAEGRGNGTSHKASMKLKLEVDKESHLLKITRKTLTPSEVSCSRKSVQLGVSLVNIGNEDEENVNVHILNSDLNINIRENIGELEAEPNEDSSRFSKTYSFSVPADAESGSYPITIRALYDDDRRKAEETATLTVNDCSTAKKTAQTSQASGEQSTEEGQDLSSAASQEDRATTVVVQQVPPDTTVSSEGFFKSNGFIVAVIIAEIIAVVVGIILIVSLVARR
ncbi:hypothetical protein HYT92_02225 [Candidatus Pacearchaeota archaeon]|nr:hypothetical protein [Candidatus Pacearchaeota archaeon]